MTIFRLCSAAVFSVLFGIAAHAEPPGPVLRDFLGICGHTIQFKPELYAPVCTLVRDYHPVDWDLADDTDKLPDFPFAKNRVDWKGVYGSWANGKFRSDVCLMFDTIPPDRWRNLDADVSAYAAAFASHFGPSGKLPLVEAIEIGNEPGNYTDPQYTALLRAVVPAVRRADPKLRIATCNLTTGASTKYSKSVETLKPVIDGLDILNVHTYAEAEPYPTWRRSFPEDPAIRYLADVMDLARWRDEHAAGKPIWITEFGYDATTKTPDPKTEFARWIGVTETQQAQYLVRSVLLFMSLPVERAYIYFFNDKDEPKLHSSSGITRDFQPKPAYHALAHLQSTLGEYRFAGVVAKTAGEIYAFRFAKGDQGADPVIVAWSPTGSGRRTSAALTLPAHTRIHRAQRMPLSKQVEEVKISSAHEIPLEESPLYLWLGADER